MRIIILLLVSCLSILDAYSQLFNDFQFTGDSVSCRLNSDQSLAITTGNVLNVVYYQDNDTSQLLYYSIIDNTSGKLIFQNPVDTFFHDGNTKTSVHDYSLFEGRNDSLYLFYLKEKTELDENYDIISRKYQVIFKKLKDDYVSPSVILYETSFPVLNIEFSVDQEGDFHGGILTQMEDWPESPVKITYVERDTAFVLDSNLVDTQMRSFDMEVDTNKFLHFFISNYDVSKDKYYLNHWKVKNRIITKNVTDSISINSTAPLFRTVKVIKNNTGKLFLVTLCDSINIYELQENSFLKMRKVPFADKDGGTILNSIIISDSLLHITTWNYEKPSKYIVVSPVHNDQNPFSATIKHAPVELKIGSNGYVYGIYGQDKLFVLTSNARLNYLLSYFSLKPQLEYRNISLCKGENMEIFYKGINVRWYDNGSLIHIGDTLNVGDLETGKHTILLSNYVLYNESLKDTLYVEMHPRPADFLRTAEIYRNDSSVLINVDISFISYCWNGIPEDSVPYLNVLVSNFSVSKINLVVTDKYNCTGSDSIFISNKKLTYISDKSYPKYSLYPNPTAYSVTVTIDHSVNKILLVDETGQVLNVIHPDSNKIIVDLNGFVRGIYYLNLITKSGKIIHKKIIKQ